MLDLHENPNAADVALSTSVWNGDFSAELVTRAKQAASAAVRRRAKTYLSDPIKLESISHGLAFADPKSLIETGRTILANELRFPRRHFGFGSEQVAINAKALIVLGRYQRRVWRSLARGE
jgi:hypothetical protein